MKKHATRTQVSKIITSLLALTLMLTMLASCSLSTGSTLNGTYKYVRPDGAYSEQFEFKSNGEMTFTDKEEKAYKGTYEIKDNKITFDYENNWIMDDETLSFEKEGNVIIIDGRKYTKEN